MEDILGKDDTLATIIEAEKKHLAKVMEYMITGAKMRGLADPGPDGS
jgi:hypothetical protein